MVDARQREPLKPCAASRYSSATVMQHAYAVRRSPHTSLALAIALLVAISSLFWRVAYHGEISRVFHVGEQHAISAEVWVRLHSSGSVLGERNLDWPLFGLWHTLAQQSSKMSLLNEAYWMLSLGRLIGVAVIFARHARAMMRADVPLALAGLGYVALFVCLGKSVLEYHIGFDRAFLPLFILAGIGLWSRNRLEARALIAAQALATLMWLIPFGMKELRIA